MTVVFFGGIYNERTQKTRNNIKQSFKTITGKRTTIKGVIKMKRVKKINHRFLRAKLTVQIDIANTYWT